MSMYASAGRARDAASLGIGAPGCQLPRRAIAPAGLYGRASVGHRAVGRARTTRPSEAGNRALYEPYNASMPLTVADLLRTPGLDVRPLAGTAATANPIRWVHVSELEDPTPWLKGGELLLTTGMGVGKTPARQRAYLNRLQQAELAALGFGTGFSFRSVPRALAEAADRAGFPIFEVPYDVPFI